MEKFRLLISNIIRGVAALVVVAPLVVPLCDISNPVAWGIAFGGLCSCVLVFGFVSLVRDAEYYIAQFLFDPSAQEESDNEGCE